jgi:pimeloyl-ACP methyl ester carboxylesterase
MIAIAQLVSVLVTAVAGPLAALLLFAAVTWSGRGVAIAVLFGLTALWLALFGRPANHAWRRQSAVILGIASVFLFSLIVARAPSGDALPAARVRHLYADGKQHERWAMANVVPEVDQLMCGFAAMPFVDPLLSHHQAAPLRHWTREIYQELEADDAFRNLGSAMKIACASLRGSEPRQHALLYIPARLDRTRPAGVLLFFHGSGGNFKAYTWLLSHVADRLNLVVLAPSHGRGNWTPAQTRAHTTTALAAAGKIVAIDAGHIHAIGLSNGGLAVSHLLANSAADYRSFIFLTPVFDEPGLRDLSHGPSAAAPLILIIAGAADRRVPLDYVETNARRLKGAGVSVFQETVPDADHFLFFSHRELILRQLEAWLRRRN